MPLPAQSKHCSLSDLARDHAFTESCCGGLPSSHICKALFVFVLFLVFTESGWDTEKKKPITSDAPTILQLTTQQTDRAKRNKNLYLITEFLGSKTSDPTPDNSRPRHAHPLRTGHLPLRSDTPAMPAKLRAAGSTFSGHPTSPSEAVVGGVQGVSGQGHSFLHFPTRGNALRPHWWAVDSGNRGEASADPLTECSFGL